MPVVNGLCRWAAIAGVDAPAKLCGQPIETVYRAQGRQPDYIEDVSGGRIYSWLEDKRYVTTVPTGTSRNNNVLTYHYQEKVQGSIARRSYLTDSNNVVRDIEYRFVR